MKSVAVPALSRKSAASRACAGLCVALMGCLLLVASPVHAQTSAQATWYESYLAGSCGYRDTIASNLFIAAWPDRVLEGGPQQDGLVDACGLCLELRCVPQFVENTRGQVFDRTSACRDPDLAVVVQIVDTCPCDAPPGSGDGNSDWCCNVPTPRFGYNRHLDLSSNVFSTLVAGGDLGQGVLGITYTPTPCSRGLGVVGGPTVPALGDLAPVPEGARILRAFQQCGGAGGLCSSQPGSPCEDAPWPGTACALGLACIRETGNPFFWQCRAPSSDPSEISNLTPGVAPPVVPAPPPSGETPAPPPSEETPAPPPSGETPAPPPSEETPAPPPSEETPAPPPSGETPTPPSPPSGGDGSLALSFWDQCGGAGGECGSSASKPCVDAVWPAASLPLGTSCRRQNEYYWQVLPDNPGSDAPLTTINGVKTLPVFAQCGGTGGSCGSEYPCTDAPWPSTECQPSTRCDRQNAYFYMCTPEGPQVAAYSGSNNRKLASWSRR